VRHRTRLSHDVERRAATDADDGQHHHFAGSAKVGDWVEAHVDVHKVGGRLAFANCYIVRDGERIVHASGVFARSGDRPASA
jgi:acyl-coenzyme A thioesterase PaaI-like protein